MDPFQDLPNQRTRSNPKIGKRFGNLQTRKWSKVERKEKDLKMKNGNGSVSTVDAVLGALDGFEKIWYPLLFTAGLGAGFFFAENDGASF